MSDNGCWGQANAQTGPNLAGNPAICRSWMKIMEDNLQNPAYKCSICHNLYLDDHH